jgi:hypothetical protein
MSINSSLDICCMGRDGRAKRQYCRSEDTASAGWPTPGVGRQGCRCTRCSSSYGSTEGRPSRCCLTRSNLSHPLRSLLPLVEHVLPLDQRWVGGWRRIEQTRECELPHMRQRTERIRCSSQFRGERRLRIPDRTRQGLLESIRGLGQGF